MEMAQGMIDKYGQENMKALAEYKAKYLPQGTETKLPNEPKDIPVGTILTQYWLNSMTYYMVTRTTKKWVEFVEILDTPIKFDHDGGGTGTRYCMPDFVKTSEVQKAYQGLVERSGIDFFNLKAWHQEEFDKLSKEDQDLYFNLSNYSGCFKKFLKLTKPTECGGFYIPGVHKGFMCGPMRLWDGTPDREYYED